MIIDLLKPYQDKVVISYKSANMPHRHVKWEMAFFCEGISKNVCGNSEIECTFGDIIIMGPPHLHSIQFMSQQHLHKDLYTSDLSIKTIADKLDPNLYKLMCDPDAPLHLRLGSNAFKCLLERLETLSILDCLSDFEPKKQCVIDSIFEYVLAYYIESSYLKHSSAPKWFREFLGLLQKDEIYCSKIEDIVKKVNYSHNYFSELFKKFTGITLIEYVTTLRMKKAELLLQNTDYSIVYICNEVGYSGQSYFIKTFTKAYGITPLQYRKKHRNIISQS